MDQKISTLEQLLTETVDSFLSKEGNQLKCKSFGSVNEGCACPMQILLTSLYGQDDVLIQSGPRLLQAKVNLSYSTDELWAFTAGFDNNYMSKFTESEFFALGERLREKYLLPTFS